MLGVLKPISFSTLLGFELKSIKIKLNRIKGKLRPLFRSISSFLPLLPRFLRCPKKSTVPTRETMLYMQNIGRFHGPNSSYFAKIEISF